MSIVVMKRKTQASVGSLSVGLPRFSLVGGHRSQGFVGQGVVSRHFTLSNSGQVSLENPAVVKPTVGNYPSPGVNSTGSVVFPCGCATYKGYLYGSQSDYLLDGVQRLCSDCVPYTSLLTLDWSNNQLLLFTAADGLTTTYALVPGQYNVVSFEQMLLGVLPTGWGLALDVPSGVFTLSNQQRMAFVVQTGSTCGAALGFSSPPLASSSYGALAMPGPCGFFTPLPPLCAEACFPRQPPVFAPKPNVVHKDSFAGGATLRQTDYADYLRKKRGLVQSSCPLLPAKTMFITSVATNLQ